MMLLVDIGNTRAKWGLLGDQGLNGCGAVLHRGVPAADWVRGLDAIGPDCDRVLVSNVAGPVAAQALESWARQRHGLCPEFVRATRAAGGVQNAYDVPEALGADRWLGMIGAWQRVRGPLVCIAAGTAMTVDAVDATGRHLGGLIVPGREMMIDALLRRTADIARGAALAPPAAEGMLGRNTAAAIQLGSVHALAALAARAVAWVTGTAGEAPRVFLGGGDAAQLQPLLGVPVESAPQLVLEGLAVIARER